MYDETHQVSIALITKCSLYAHGSLFGLLYLGADISRRTWYTGKPRTYDKTHQVQIALITKCGLYAHGYLFALLYLGANISRHT